MEKKTAEEFLNEKVPYTGHGIPWRNLMAENSAAKFFAETTYESRGKYYPMYVMTRDGFSLLVMGFTRQRSNILCKQVPKE